MLHTSPSPLAGKSIKIITEIKQIGGKEILIEDYWDRIAGKSWRDSDGIPAALDYAFRIGMQRNYPVPTDDNVLYGKIGLLGFLIHESELETV